MTIIIFNWNQCFASHPVMKILEYRKSSSLGIWSGVNIYHGASSIMS